MHAELVLEVRSNAAPVVSNLLHLLQCLVGLRAPALQVLNVLGAGLVESVPPCLGRPEEEAE
ncbi:hypothetical protein ACH4YO_08185 [Streptomyces noursei]|uniref:hypothetical protein n=1 Tax=Streptomyces noursei TaxID=1971 RepID=UPI0033CE472F